LILDSSVVIAVLFREVGCERLEEAMGRASGLAIGAPTLFETGMVAVGRFGEEGLAFVQGFVEDWEVEVIPFGESHWRIASETFARYGKGRHPARLNFGDCMTYATASVVGRPLLFIGGDFARTDIAPA
jgi:ribonuclease VapC